MQGNVFIEIDPEQLPVGPEGKSAYQVWLDNGNTGTETDFLDWLRNGQVSSGCVSAIKYASLGPTASTSSTTYVATGLQCQATAGQGDCILVDVRGMVNHTSQNIIHFTLRRNGTDITPSGNTGISTSRIDIADGVRAVSFQFNDTPPVGVATYELLWKCHNQGVAYLGRRKDDTAMMVNTSMSLTVYKP